MENLFTALVSDLPWRLILAAGSALGITGWGFLTEKSRGNRRLHSYQLVTLFLIVFTVILVALNQINFALVEQQSRGILRPDADQLTSWLTEMGVSVRKNSNQDAAFVLDVTDSNGRTTHIILSQHNKNLLVFEGYVAITETLKTTLDNLTPSAKERVMSTLTNQLVVLGLAPRSDMSRIGVQEVVVYGEPLTQEKVFEKVRKVSAAMSIIEFTLRFLPIEDKIRNK